MPLVVSQACRFFCYSLLRFAILKARTNKEAGDLVSYRRLPPCWIRHWVFRSICFFFFFFWGCDLCTTGDTSQHTSSPQFLVLLFGANTKSSHIHSLYVSQVQSICQTTETLSRPAWFSRSATATPTPSPTLLSGVVPVLASAPDGSPCRSSDGSGPPRAKSR